MSFYLSLFVFILSFIIGLILMITGKNMQREKFFLLASVHAIFLFAFIASLLLSKNDEALVYNYFFMIYICSGLVLSGLSWRSNSPMILKLYFSIFALSIPLFLISPSTLLNFLLTTNFTNSNGTSFHLNNHYYIENQSVTRKKDNLPHYKVIQKRRLFHKTIQRDVVFKGKLDSVKVLEVDPGTSMWIRGYSSRTTFVSSEVDSTDVMILFKISKQGDVEYRL